MNYFSKYISSIFIPASTMMMLWCCTASHREDNKTNPFAPLVIQGVRIGSKQYIVEPPKSVELIAIDTVMASNSEIDTMFNATLLVDRISALQCSSNVDSTVKDIVKYLRFPIGQNHDMVDFIGGAEALYHARVVFRDSRNQIWFGSIGGVCCLSQFDNNTCKLKYYSESEGLCYNVVNAITEDNSGNIWFGTGNGKISIFDGTSFINLNTSGDAILCFVKDHYGQIWAGSYDGLRAYDMLHHTCTVYTDRNGLCNNSVQCLFEDSRGRIWIGTEKGVTCYNPNSDSVQFSKFTKADSLSCEIINSISEDSFKNLWFGTNGGGAIRYDGNSLMFFTTAQGLPTDTVNSIYRDADGRLLFGTSENICFIEKAQLENLTDQAQLLNPGQNPLFIISKVKLCPILRNSVCEDAKGKLWWGTKGGVARTEI